MSLSVLLADKHLVKILEIDQQRVKKINSNESTIEDNKIDEFLKTKKLNIEASSDSKFAYKDSDFIIICTPTDYDTEANYFDTSSIDHAVKEILSINEDALIIIKSTIPVGYTEKLKKKFNTKNIVFSPEFLREGNALNDNLNPSRIIIGGNCSKSKQFSKLLIESSINENVPIFFTSSTEAEAIKLFANTYLAMRIAFFNELDNFAMIKDLDTKNIINGVCSDKRIGHGYNNPSFGYGGYCLPKDTKQLLSNYESIPQKLIQATVDSNEARKTAIVNEIVKKNPRIIGIFRLVMKKDSNNFRSSAILDIIKDLLDKNKEVVIFEPSINDPSFEGLDVINNLIDFKSSCDLILANRNCDSLNDVMEKTITRDIFNEN